MYLPTAIASLGLLSSAALAVPLAVDGSAGQGTPSPTPGANPGTPTPSANPGVPIPSGGAGTPPAGTNPGTGANPNPGTGSDSSAGASPDTYTGAGYEAIAETLAGAIDRRDTPSTPNGPQAGQGGSVTVSNLCAFPVYLSTPSGDTTLYSKMLPYSEPYSAVNVASTIRVSKTANDGTVGIRPTLLLEYERGGDGNVFYDITNIDGNAFAEEGFGLVCENGGSFEGTEDQPSGYAIGESGGTNYCKADSDLTLTLCNVN